MGVPATKVFLNEKKVPTREIDQAAARIEKCKTNPEKFRLSVDEEGNENG